MSEESIKVVYKGVEITYFELMNRWECVHSGKRYEKESLAQVKARVDSWVKAENVFPRIPAIQKTLGSYGSSKFGTNVIVTSITEDGDIWLMINGERSKLCAECINDELAADNAHNKKLVDDVKSYQEQIKVIEANIKRCISEMDPIDIGGAK